MSEKRIKTADSAAVSAARKIFKARIRAWKAYEKVRLGGRFNMFDPRARQATGLGPEMYSYVMENYEELKEKAQPQP